MSRKIKNTFFVKEIRIENAEKCQVLVTLQCDFPPKKHDTLLGRMLSRFLLYNESISKRPLLVCIFNLFRHIHIVRVLLFNGICNKHTAAVLGITCNINAVLNDHIK